MSDDLVKRLRKGVYRTPGSTHESDKVMYVAADRIEQLETALKRVVDLTERWQDSLVLQVNEIAHDGLEVRNV